MPKNNPTISVIIPTYNRANFLTQSIPSVLNQTYRNFEIIIVDDNSTDNTVEVLENYDDKRIKYIKNNENRGVGSARNQGIKIARGEYITFLDSDDTLLSPKFEKQLNKFELLSDDCGLVYCGFCYVFDYTGQIQKRIFPKFQGNVFDNLLGGNIFPIHAPLVKRECFEKCGQFDVSLPACEDWDLWIRFARHYKFAFVPDILTKYYIHGQQKSVEIRKVIMARKSIVEKYQSELEQRPRILARHLRRIAALYCLSDKSMKGREYFIASIRYDPLYYGNYVHLFLSFFSRKIHKQIISRYSVLTIGNVRLTF